MPRNALIQVRMTPEERDFLQAQAQGRSLSVHLRVLGGLQPLNPTFLPQRLVDPQRSRPGQNRPCVSCGELSLILINGRCRECV